MKVALIIVEDRSKLRRHKYTARSLRPAPDALVERLTTASRHGFPQCALGGVENAISSEDS